MTVEKENLQRESCVKRRDEATPQRKNANSQLCATNLTIFI